MAHGTITYRLTEAGRKASLISGGNGQEIQTVAGELTPENIDLFTVAADGKAALDIFRTGEPERDSLYTANVEWKRYAATVPMEFEALLVVARDFRALRQAHADAQPARLATKQAEERTTAEAAQADLERKQADAIAELSALTPDALADDAQANRDNHRFRDLLGSPDGKYHHNFSGYPRKSTFEPAQALIETANGILAARRQVEAESENAKAAAKRAWQAEWLASNGTHSQRARDEEGLLPNAELEAAIKDWAFRALAGEVRYQPLVASEVRATCAEKCVCGGDGYGAQCTINFSSEEADEATNDEFNRLLAIRALVPDGTVELRLHTGKCDDSDCDPDEDQGIATRKGFMVEIVAGPFTLHREYAV